ncbi:DUF501 domain-containing protein [Candidatus Bipolaricaulota bacterium]
MERVTVNDRRVIASQIGREPRGVSAVSRRCAYGHPAVIRVHPVVDGEPFPTLYWLTCPYLALGVDRLESEGAIGRLEARLASDAELASRLEVAREEYVRGRLELLSASERRDLQERGILPSLSEKGIGGIAERGRIKCLHLHVAQALAGANPIGEIVLEDLERIECPPEKVICSTPVRVEQIVQIKR